MMRYFAICSLCLATGLAGCSSFSNLTGGKNKPNTTASTPSSSSPMVGSSELTNSNKLANPTKIHLAYAAWHEQSGDLPEARESYLKVYQKNPKDVDALLGLARIDRAYGRTDEADSYLKKATKLHPKNPKVFVAMGQAHAAKKEWDQAIDKMETACKLAPYDSIYQYHLAVVEAGAGDIPTALEHFKRSVGEAEAHFNVGFILNDQGRTSEAETHLIQALKLKPDLKQAQATLVALRSNKDGDVLPASFTNSTRSTTNSKSRSSASSDDGPLR